MPKAAIALNLLFFPPMIAGNVLLLWAFHQTKKAGLWRTEKFFGFEIRRRWDVLHVIKLLRQRVESADDPAESRRYRTWLHAIYLGYALGLFAIVVLLAFTPWLFSQVPELNK